MPDLWKPIETAPKDGSLVRLKRLYQGRVVAEGMGLWGMLADAAPSRSAMGPDPLGRLSADDYKQEAAAVAEWSSSTRWLKSDRMYAFPTPTHWMPLQERPFHA